jgi:nucleoside-diphosphate-sugar epimerase
MTLPTDEAGIEELLSRPTPGLLQSLERLPGDIAILGVGGKMGPTLARMARRALDQLGRNDRVLGVARFSDESARGKLEEAGVETVRCDLLDAQAVRELPDAPNLIFMAGQKFGTASGPELTWAMNTLAPAHVAARYTTSRIVAFSTGCVYPLVPVTGGGPREDTPPAPPGDYANSCVGRERIFEYYAKRNGTPVCLFRLNYAVDMRYGVLLDVAQKVWNEEPFDVTMGHANVIWQGDANARALQALEVADSPAVPLNVTGPETISLRALAHRFGELFGREARITGEEAPTAWLNNAARSFQLFGYPHVALEQMIEWTAQWVQAGGSTLGKPTHFEEREGKF